MKKIKKIALITFWCLLVGGLLISLGFVNKEQETLLCNNLEIKINQNGDLNFLDNDDVTKLITDRGDSIINQPKSSINVSSIEKALNSYFAIENAEVFMSIDGKVSVELTQRNPIIRLITKTGEDYYIDDKGKPMPLSEKYTAKVIIANGNLDEPYALRYKYSAEEISRDTLLNKKSMIDELYTMAMYINKSEFWKSQIHQIYVNENNDMELVPLAGNQKIIFGDTTNLENKFEKLMIFYKNGLNATGWWDKYSTINLKFKNQIVCTKK